VVHCAALFGSGTSQTLHLERKINADGRMDITELARR